MLMVDTLVDGRTSAAVLRIDHAGPKFVGCKFLSVKILIEGEPGKDAVFHNCSFEDCSFPEGLILWAFESCHINGSNRVFGTNVMAWPLNAK